MQSKATTVRAYLDSLPPDRRRAIQAVRKVIKQNLGKGYAEGMQYGMIGFYVPHSVYPPGYHCDPEQPLPFAGLASQKNHMGMYLFCLYNDAGGMKRFQSEWKKTGKKLDMGKSCIRFKSLEDVPLDVVGDAIRRVPVKTFVAHYEANIQSSTAKRRSAKKAAKKATKKAARKTVTKNTTKKAATRAPKKTARKKAARKKTVRRSGSARGSSARR